MKKLLFTFFLFFSVIVYGQDTTKSQTPVLDKTEKMIDKYGAKIADGFSTAMEKATPVAKEGFQALVMYQVAHGIGCLVPLVLLFVFIILCTKEYKRIETILSSDKVPSYMDRHKDPYDNCTISLLVYTILGILSGVLAVFFTYSGIVHILAPKWFAIKDVIDLVKN